MSMYRHNANNGTVAREQQADHISLNYGDTGGPSRYFYVAKASKRDRSSDGAVNNTHPTCKPSTLIRYLCKLICPLGGTILDPFLGSGTTAVAAILEGFNCVGIDNEAEYLAIAQARCDHAIEAAQPEVRAQLPLLAAG
jgi:site-specific DNA-methyltransferase (adenine-specific)